MASSVQIDWQVEVAAYEAALSECPGATFFHTSAWLEVVRRTFHSEIARVRATLPDGRWGLLALSVRPLAKGLVPLAMGGETGAYNGLVSPYSLAEEEVSQIYAAVLARYASMRIVGNPFAVGPHMPEAQAGGKREMATTHTLLLKPFPELRAGFSRGAKARGNKARKQSLRLELTHDPARSEVFYRLYLDSVRRWGDKLTWARSPEFFRALLEEGGARAKLFIAHREDEAISALLFAEYGATAHYIAGATDARHLEISPSNFLMEEALAHYAEAGFQHFDFGPSNGLEGVVQFKESLGARPVPFYAQTFHSPAARLYFALRKPYEQLKALRRPAMTRQPTT